MRIWAATAASVCFAFLYCTETSALSSVWRNDWTAMATPTIARIAYVSELDRGPNAFEFAPNGDLLFSSLTYFPYSGEAFRLSADGSLRWSVSTNLPSGYEVPSVFSAADGGAFIAGEYKDDIIRVDSSGSILWSRQIPAQWLGLSAGDQVAAIDCSLISFLESATGQVVLQNRFAGELPNCEVSGFVVEGEAGFYLSVSNNIYLPTSGSRALKLDASGQVLWVTPHAGDTAKLIGIDGNQVYIATESSVIALDATTGGQVWQSPSITGNALLVAGTPAIPVVVSANSINGIDPLTGLVQWTQAINGSDVSAAIGGSVLVNTQSGLLKLDAVSGAIAWSSPLPAVDTLGNPVDVFVGLGGLTNGRFLAVARVDAPSSQPPPFVLSIDFLSGQPIKALPVPETPQGITGESVVDANGIISMQVVQDAETPTYRLDRIDSADGAQIWTRSDPVMDPSLTNSGYGPKFSLGTGANLVAASINEGGFPRSNAAIGAWELTNGALRWRTALRPTDEAWYNTDISIPVVDADSNVLVSLGTYVDCGLPDICWEQTLYQLGATGGSISWQRTKSYSSQGGVQPLVLAPPFASIDGDIVLAEGGSVVRLDGGDGNLLWSANVGSTEFLQSPTTGISSLSGMKAG